MRVWKAYLTRNSEILLLLRPCPLGASYGQEGRMEEWSREILSVSLRLEISWGSKCLYQIKPITHFYIVRRQF